jgi:hypothetical protein
VRFELHPKGDTTVLVLDVCRLSVTSAKNYGADWHAHLDLLKALVSGADIPQWRYKVLRPQYAGFGQRS